MPLVSVILPSFRMGRFVPQALGSVGAQTHGDWEVILVDDCGPEDGTREAVESFAREHPSKRVEYIRNAENVGCGHSRNIAMAEARGDFLAFLDPDDFWGPRYLERAVRGIGNADFCFCRCRSVDEDGKDLGSHTGGRMEELVAGFPRSLFRENFLIPSCTFVRRNVPERFAFFTARRDAMYAADWDFYLRCIARGAHFVFLDGEDCYYRRHAGAATNNYLKMTNECVLILRDNWRAAGGLMKGDLAATLHEHLCRLAYLRISFRMWRGLGDAFEAWRRKPFDAAPFVQVARGLRNNWKDLR
ncbi:MAG: glycosyltransferase family 2 protein [Chthoniobacterales bacterium]|nr:glycosyltransferase family 2 protein [Chthoniobacterales bacterium]